MDLLFVFFGSEILSKITNNKTNCFVICYLLQKPEQEQICSTDGVLFVLFVEQITKKGNGFVS